MQTTVLVWDFLESKPVRRGLKAGEWFYLMNGILNQYFPLMETVSSTRAFQNLGSLKVVKGNVVLSEEWQRNRTLQSERKGNKECFSYQTACGNGGSSVVPRRKTNKQTYNTIERNKNDTK